ncbi:MAG: GtrA family protein, partial [Acetatifactor sp.]|nr:GtrA family protein [Acetatifactor sp.]
MKKRNLVDWFRDWLERWPKIHELFCKYEEILVYLVVGVMTTIVSWVACYLSKFILDSDVSWQNAMIQTIGWVSGVLFSYPLSRSWVFKSVNPNVLGEFAGFAGSRVSTWILDIVIMWVTVNLMGMSYW